MHICIVMLCLSVAASKPSSHSLRETPLFFSVSVRPEPVLANEPDTGYEFLAPDFVVLESHVHLLDRGLIAHKVTEDKRLTDRFAPLQQVVVERKRRRRGCVRRSARPFQRLHFLSRACLGIIQLCCCPLVPKEFDENEEARGVSLFLSPGWA